MDDFECKIRVQYFDTDKMQVVHHANYIRFFETARTEYLRHFGFAYSDMEKEHMQIPVLSVNAKFRTPAVYDELISIKCRIVKLGPAHRRTPCHWSQQTRFHQSGSQTCST